MADWQRGKYHKKIEGENISYGLLMTKGLDELI